MQVEQVKHDHLRKMIDLILKYLTYEYLNVGLIFVMVFICIFKRDTATNIFVILTGAYSVPAWFIPESQGLVYYLGAAVTDLLIIFMINYLKLTSSIAIKLQRISKLFIAVNFIGWVFWMLYTKPFIYNSLSSILYLSAIFFILTNRNSKNADDSDRLVSGNVRFFSDIHSRDNSLSQYKKATRT